MESGYQTVKLADLHPYKKNPRINDDAVDAVAESIKEFGFKNPIIATADGEIICGHTRYKAAKSLGIDDVPCIVVNDLTDEQVRAFRIADNKTADMSIWDNKLLLEELEALPDDIFTGFDLGDLFDEMNEDDEDAVDENEYGLVYEITLRSENKELIDEVKSYWEELTGEDGHTGSGDFGEEAGWLGQETD